MEIFGEQGGEVFGSEYRPIYRLVFIEPGVGDPTGWEREVILIQAEDIVEVLELAEVRAAGRLWGLALRTPVQSPDRAPGAYVLTWLSGMDPRASTDPEDTRLARMRERLEQQ